MLFLSPWIIGFLLFTAGPILASLVLSFMKWDVISPAKWVGLANYKQLFNDPLLVKVGRHLELTPRAPQADFQTLTFQIDRRSLTFRGLVIVDEQGGTSAFRFSDLRENVGLSDREFEFSIPRGVEVR